MRLILTFIFLQLLTCISIQAQNYSLTWGKEFKEPNFDFTFLPSYDSSEYFAFSKRLVPIPFSMAEQKPTFRRFSKEKELLTSNELALNKEIPLLLKNKMYILYPLKNKSGLEVLYADELDTKTLQTKNKAVEITSTENTKPGIMISLDRSKFLVSKKLSEKKKNKITYTVFDDQLKVVWEKEIQIPDSVKIFNAKSGILDENGNLYLGVLESDGKEIKIKNEKSNHSFVIFTIRNNGQSISRIPLKLDGVSVTDMKIKVRDNFLFCAGFYSRKVRTGARGNFLIKIDLENGEIASSIKTDFDSDFIQNNNAPTQEVGVNDDELESFQLQHFFITKDNSFLLLATL